MAAISREEWKAFAQKEDESPEHHKSRLLETFSFSIVPYKDSQCTTKDMTAVSFYLSYRREIQWVACP